MKNKNNPFINFFDNHPILKMFLGISGSSYKYSSKPRIHMVTDGNNHWLPAVKGSDGFYSWSDAVEYYDKQLNMQTEDYKP